MWLFIVQRIHAFVTINYCQLRRNDKVLLMSASFNQWDVLQVITWTTSFRNSKCPFPLALFAGSRKAILGRTWGTKYKDSERRSLRVWRCGCASGTDKTYLLHSPWDKPYPRMYKNHYSLGGIRPSQGCCQENVFPAQFPRP